MECSGNFFICNGALRKAESFDDSMIKVGKSVYEVIRIINGVPLFFERHMKRFSNSTRIINKKALAQLEEVKMDIKKLVEKEKIDNGNIKIVFNYNEEKENYYIYSIKHKYPDREFYEKGVKTILYHGERENPNAKVINLEFRKNVETSIDKNNAYEAILVDRNGFITEGSKSNIFMVYNNKVITSPLEAVLPGVTREVIISILREAAIPFEEEKYHYKNIKELDALFISGTSPKILPIGSVDDYAFNSSRNEIVSTITKLYDEYLNEYIESFKF